jgi:hypothetical protein
MVVLIDDRDVGDVHVESIGGAQVRVKGVSSSWQH